MVFNEKKSPEEYKKIKEELNLNTNAGREEARKKSAEFFLTKPHRYVQMERTENCTGDHLYDSKNSSYCIDCKDMEDCKYCARCFSVKSSLDYTSWGDNSELIYQCAACGDHAYNLKFCTTCVTNNSNLEYCGHCTSSKNSFGCVGLRRKEYCILNKQYSKEEYEKLREKIISHMKETGEWGEYFPKKLASFGYNETLAMECFPLTKDEALKRGYKWKERDDAMPQVEKIISASQLPESINEVPNDILNWAVKCEKTERPFRIVKQELAFYRKQGLPIPHFHPDERHWRRIALRNPPVFYNRQCDKCSKDMETTYSPERPEKVYCEECYLKEVY